MNIGSLSRERTCRKGFLDGLVGRVDELCAQKREAATKSRSKHAVGSIKSPTRVQQNRSGVSSKEESLFKEFEQENASKAVVDISNILSKSSRSPYSAFCSVSAGQFNPETEKKKKFGNTSVDVDPNRASYRERLTRMGSGRYARNRLDQSVISMMTRSQKSRVFTQHLPAEMVMMAPKLFRVTVDPVYTVPIGNTSYPVSDSVGTVRLVATDRTQQLHETYQRIKQTHDLDSLVHFVQRHPYYPPSTLHLSYVLEYLHQQQDTLQLLEQALAAVEQSLGSMYLRALLDGKLKLSAAAHPAYLPESAQDCEYDLGPELASSILKLFMRAALFFSKKSLHSSAAAYSQIALNAVPVSLPSNGLLVMDDLEGANKQTLIPRPDAYLSLSHCDPGASLILHDYYLLRSTSYQRILLQFFTYTCLDSAVSLHPQHTDSLLFDFVHLPRSIDEASVYSDNPEFDVIPTFTALPNPSSTPLGTKVIPFTQVPLRYAANWCYTAAIAAYYLSLDVNKKEAILTADTPLGSLLCFGGCRIVNNTTVVSKYNLSSLLLQRAILLYPELFVQLVSKFEDKYTKNAECNHIISFFTNKFVTNKYLDRVATMYVQRHVTLWRLLSVNQTATFLPFLLENARVVIQRYQNSSELHSQIASVRDVVYNEHFYVKHSFAFSLLEPSEYSEAVASIPMEVMNAQPRQQQQQQQPRQGQPPSRGMTRLSTPTPNNVIMLPAQPPTRTQPLRSQPSAVVVTENAQVESDIEESSDFQFSPDMELDTVLPARNVLDSDDEYLSMEQLDDEEDDEGIREGRRLRDCIIPIELSRTLLMDNGAATDADNIRMMNTLFQEFISTQVSGNVPEEFFEILLTTFIDAGICAESITDALQTGELNSPS